MVTNVMLNRPIGMKRQDQQAHMWKRATICVQISAVFTMADQRLLPKSKSQQSEHR